MHKTAVTQGKESGHGIGLTQVWETLDHNQGELNVVSELGLGTTITLTFPRIKAPHWIAEEITGYYPSFFAYWKKVEKNIQTK